MKALLWFAVAAVLVGVAGGASLANEFAWLDDQPGQACDAGTVGCCPTPDRSCGACCPPVWDVKAGAVYLQRDRLPSRDLAQGLSAGTPQTLNARDFRFDYEFGPDLTVIRRGERADLEFRWFQVQDWIAEGPTLTDAIGGALNFQRQLQMQGATTLDSRYLSQVRSFELNAKRQFAPRLTGLAGFRFAQLDERLDLTGTVAGSTFSSPVKAFNNLYGFQLGGELSVWDVGGPLRITAVGKAGIYANDARNQAVMFLNGTEIGVDSASASREAFLAELGLIGTYQITDRWSASAGYQVMWLDGIAMASQQQALLDPITPGTATIDMAGTAFYHGITASIGCQW